MAPEAYNHALAESGKLKLRATALLALGDDEDRFQAAVLFHEAVRVEERALAALPAPDARTRLRFAIERCGCLLDGLDPHAASRAWGDVLVASEMLPVEEARAFRTRIDPKYARQEKAFGVLLRKHRLALHEGAFVSASTAAPRPRADLAALVKAYPGVADLWFRQSRLFEQAGQIADARRSLERARQLAPDEPPFKVSAP